MELLTGRCHIHHGMSSTGTTMTTTVPPPPPLKFTYWITLAAAEIYLDRSGGGFQLYEYRSAPFRIGRVGRYTY